MLTYRIYKLKLKPNKRRIYSTYNHNIRNIIEYRLDLWNKEKERQKSVHTQNNKIIEITLPDGKKISSEINTTLSKINNQYNNENLLGAIVVNELDVETSINQLNEYRSSRIIDFITPIDQNIKVLKWISFDDPEGKSIFWHSSAHILGYAIENLMMNEWNEEGLKLLDSNSIESIVGSKVPLLDDGPALHESIGGFFYDFYINKHFGESDFKKIEKRMLHLASIKLPFERLQTTKEFAMKMFSYNPLKQRIISKINDEGNCISLYKYGDFIDLCRGPHVQHSGLLKELKVLRGSSVYLDGDNQNISLQRIYGISFPSKELFTEWKRLREEAERRDHRLIGKNQSLFMFSTLSPGSPFFLPYGTRIFNKLVDLMKNECKKRGFKEVITPLIFDETLWKTSGHWDHYKDNMYLLQKQTSESNSENDETTCSGLKPMNCPGHCLTYKHHVFSYRDLPIRYSDFSSLHRNEAKGSLTGLTRVRRFHQDDGHIFCRKDQIKDELFKCISFVDHLYKNILKFNYKILISTRPDEYIGEIEEWDHAEMSLIAAINELNLPYTINAKDGAFYGPKIDFVIMDALKREHQCATIQLDFQLPQRFELYYIDSNGNHQVPVIIHRAVLGSIERMFALLTEHYGGRWPFWLSPRQVAICTISDKYIKYAETVCKQIEDRGFYVEKYYDDHGLSKKVRTAQKDQCNYILVIGEKEEETKTVSVRKRDGTILDNMDVASLIEIFNEDLPYFPEFKSNENFDFTSRNEKRFKEKERYKFILKENSKIEKWNPILKKKDPHYNIFIKEVIKYQKN